MPKRAKPFWVKEEEQKQVNNPAPYADIALLATGEDDDAWKFGSD